MPGNSTPIVLQARDLLLLREASGLKVFDRTQAQLAAGFKSVTRANSRLPKLVASGVLRRFYMASELGGKKALYSLTPKGAALAGVPDTGITRPQNQFVVSDLYVAHQLQINELYLQLSAFPLPGGLRLQGWRSFPNQLSESSRIIPDGYFEIATPYRSVASFLEVDLGTESLRIWKSKIEAYLSFATTGEFQQRFGHSQFRVMVVVPSEARAKSLRKLIAQYTAKVFWVSTFQTIKQNGFWSAIWQRPDGGEPKPFIEVLP